jgi:hypothetical protein
MRRVTRQSNAVSAGESEVLNLSFVPQPSRTIPESRTRRRTTPSWARCRTRNTPSPSRNARTVSRRARAPPNPIHGPHAAPSHHSGLLAPVRCARIVARLRRSCFNLPPRQCAREKSSPSWCVASWSRAFRQCCDAARAFRRDPQALARPPCSTLSHSREARARWCVRPYTCRRQITHAETNAARPQTGRVTLNGQRITHRIFSQHCSYVPQDDQQWTFLTCREHLSYATSFFNSSKV